MSSINVFGSDVADATLTTACDMSTTTGGTEVGKQTVNNGATGLNFMELFSQGSSGISGVSSLPTPTGHGWVYKPGSGSTAAGNWSASVTFQGVSLGTSSLVIRFYKFDGSSTYTSIGSITKTGVVSAKTTYSFAATSMPSTSFLSTDYIYTDLWLNDTSGTFGDNPTVYESNSSSQGVSGDMNVTTSNFTPSSSSPVLPIRHHAFGRLQ